MLQLTHLTWYSLLSTLESLAPLSYYYSPLSKPQIWETPRTVLFFSFLNIFYIPAKWIHLLFLMCYMPSALFMRKLYSMPGMLSLFASTSLSFLLSLRLKLKATEDIYDTSPPTVQPLIDLYLFQYPAQYLVYSRYVINNCCWFISFA